MVNSLPNLVNNLGEKIRKVDFKYVRDDKKCETCGIKYKDCNWFLEYANFKNNLLNTNVCVVTIIIRKGFMKNWRKDFSIHINYLTMVSISLFYWCENLFAHMNIQMTGKN